MNDKEQAVIDAVRKWVELRFHGQGDVQIIGSTQAYDAAEKEIVWSIDALDQESGVLFAATELKDDYGFAVFWDAYPPPRKGKAAAQKAWRRLKPNITLRSMMMAALATQIPTWRKGYIPHASTWINGRRWEDETEKTMKSFDPLAWSDECNRVHAGSCRNAHDHKVKMQFPDFGSGKR